MRLTINGKVYEDVVKLPGVERFIVDGKEVSLTRVMGTEFWTGELGLVTSPPEEPKEEKKVPFITKKKAKNDD